jgi:acylphosphatase
METNVRAVRARITGRVQGVCFRTWARSEALQIGVTGWVRNERDGSVTAMIAGPKGCVARMIDALWEGPAAAAVSYVATEDLDDVGERPAQFSIQ